MKLDLCKSVFAFLTTLDPTEEVFVAYSGGLDSTVLLYVLKKWHEYSKQPLHAVYVNHHISKHADSWGEFCRKTCASLDVHFTTCDVFLSDNQKQHNLEEQLRKLRYQQLGKMLSPGAYLLTAHHANDQAETLLLQLLRGAGVNGLAAMPKVRIFANGFLVRPLLHFTRSELLQFAEQHQLSWIEDESNQDLRFQRNLVRHKIFPILNQTWPGVIRTSARSAEYLAEAVELLAEVAREDLTKVYDARQDALLIDQLNRLSYARQKNLLRYWLKQHSVILPNAAKLQEFLRQLTGRTDAQPCLAWQEFTLRKYRNWLYLVPNDFAKTKFTIHSDQKLRCFILQNSLKQLVIQIAPKYRWEDFSIGFRRGGESVRKEDGTHQQLKKLLQNWGVPPWRRTTIPLVIYRGEIIAVIGYYEPATEYLQIRR